MTTPLKLIGAPGSITFLVVCVTVGLMLVRMCPGRPMLSIAWFGLLGTVYLVLATPVVAIRIGDALVAAHQPTDLQRLTPVDLLVVFDGDNRRGRVAEALRVGRAWPSTPIRVVGDTWIRDQLVRSGMPSRRVSHDQNPSTTLEQVRVLREYRDGGQPRARIAVVASRLQVPRLRAFADTVGVPSVLFLASPVDVEPTAEGIGAWIPQYIALRLSRDAIYELAAISYYRWTGVIHQQAIPAGALGPVAVDTGRGGERR